MPERQLVSEEVLRPQTQPLESDKQLYADCEAYRFYPWDGTGNTPNSTHQPDVGPQQSIGFDI
jgi:hypothetical protein